MKSLWVFCVFLLSVALLLWGEGTPPILMIDLYHHGDLTLCMRGVMAYPDLDSGEFMSFHLGILPL